MKKGYRIHKVRFASFLLFLVMIFSFCTVNVLGADRNLTKTEVFHVKEQPIVQDYEVVCVKSGDSLWILQRIFANWFMRFTRRISLLME